MQQNVKKSVVKRRAILKEDHHYSERNIFVPEDKKCSLFVVFHYR